MESEIWKPVPGMNGVLASSLGRIMAPKGMGNSVKTTLCVRHQSVAHNGYFSVRIGNKNHYVHRLICIAYHGAPNGKKSHAAHFDGNPSNNLPGNLRWVTPKENAADKVRHGRQPRMAGERSGMAKLTDDEVRRIRAAIASGLSQREIGKRFGVSHTTVYSIGKGEVWSHVDP